MAFTQDFRTQRRNYDDGDIRIGEIGRLWYDSKTNTIRISDGVTPGGIVVSAEGGGAGGQVFDTFTITKSLTLTTNWQDTGITGSDITTGTYIVQLFANDVGAGGTNATEYYSGVMSWFSGITNGTTELPTDEIPLHRAGGGGSSEIYLRTFRTPAGESGRLKLQIYSNIANASPANYVFKFIRML